MKRLIILILLSCIFYMITSVKHIYYLPKYDYIYVGRSNGMFYLNVTDFTEGEEIYIHITPFKSVETKLSYDFIDFPPEDLYMNLTYSIEPKIYVDEDSSLYEYTFKREGNNTFLAVRYIYIESSTYILITHVGNYKWILYVFLGIFAICILAPISYCIYLKCRK